MTDTNSKARTKNVILALPEDVKQILVELSKEFYPFHRKGEGGNLKAYCEMVLMNHIKKKLDDGTIVQTKSRKKKQPA